MLFSKIMGHLSRRAVNCHKMYNKLYLSIHSIPLIGILLLAYILLFHRYNRDSIVNDPQAKCWHYGEHSVAADLLYIGHMYYIR